MSEEERRQTPRQPVEFTVAVDDSSEVLEGVVRDASAGGCFVETDRQLEPGTALKVSAIGEDDEIFAFGAEVIRTVADGDRRGMGLRFTHTGPEALKGLRQQLVAGQRVRVQPAETDQGE